jgi:LysR family glycine cleavage system transcriptional activator
MLPKRFPSLPGLRAFEAAARRLSFTDAARELHVTQAAISRHVRTLESQLGRPLFRRLHRSVELTVPGKRLASGLAAGFSQIQRSVDAVRALTTRHLRIAVEPAFASRWLVARLGGFSAAHPDIELELESSDELRVLGHDTDIAIRFLGPKARRPGKRARKLFSLDGFPVIARAGIEVKRSPRRDAEILDYRLLHDDDGSTWRNWFAVAGLTGFEQAKHLHFNDYSLVLTAALRGQGVALSAPMYVQSELKTGRLIRIGQSSVTFGDYWLLEASDRINARARATFAAWTVAQIRQSEPSMHQPPTFPTPAQPRR